MAKGDSNPTKSASGTGIPKQDQYSVMHAIMDNLSGNGIAPTQMPGSMPRSPDQGQMDMTPNSNQFGTTNSMISYPNNQPPMGGRFNGGMGLPRMGSMSRVDAGGAGSMQSSPMGPSNPQEMMRRTMMGKNSFGGA